MTTTTFRTRRFALAPALAVAVLCAAAGPAGAAAAPAPSSSLTPAPRQSLTGTVTDSEGQPVADARVVAVEADRVVLTDARGAFRFAELAAGRYTLEVTRPGYEARLVTVDAPGSVDVTLRPSPLPVQALTVTVTRGAISPLRSPLAASAVGREALDRDHGISLAQTLEQLPGVRDLSTGHEIGKPVIRGLSGCPRAGPVPGAPPRGLRLERRGRPRGGRRHGRPDRGDPGPASVLYGADAVGGVVNVIPRPLPEAARRSRLLDGSAELRLRVEQQGGRLRAPRRGRRRSVGVAGHGRRALRRGAAHARGRAGEHRLRRVQRRGALVRRGSWGTFTTRFVHNGGEFKLLEEDAPPGGDHAAWRRRAGRSGSSWTTASSSWATSPWAAPTAWRRGCRASATTSSRWRTLPNADPAAPKVEVEAFDLTLTTGLGRALLHHSLAPGTSGTVGVTGKAQSSATDGVLEIIPGANVMAGGGCSCSSAPSAVPLTLLGGVRSDLVQIDADGQGTRNFEALTGARGPHGTWWKASPSRATWAPRGARPPSSSCTRLGPRLGEARYEIGDPALDKERSLNLDAGLRLSVGARARLGGGVQERLRSYLFIQPTEPDARRLPGLRLPAGRRRAPGR